MPKFTPEQQQAIDVEGFNVLVSAGAGSGKTAVLTERVLRKVKQGIHINQLLILTFTNKAAMEMQARIRQKLMKENFQEELLLMDNSYITTFDSFSLSVVRKYADFLHVSSNITIAENSVLQLAKQKLIDELFLEYYQNPTPNFEKMIHLLCLKDDKSLKNIILELDDKMDLLLNRDEYIEKYMDWYYSPSNLNHYITLYNQVLDQKINALEEEYQIVLSYSEGKFQEKLHVLLDPFFSEQEYQKRKEKLPSALPNLPKNSSEELKTSKTKLAKMLKEIHSYFSYQDEKEIYEKLFSTKELAEFIIECITRLNQKIKAYKEEKQYYTFLDIEKMAIELVRDFEEVRNELRDSFQEILIDEYQDTNDIQECFISYIAKHNVYMVGDIKQSIYRFRNANPLIFKDKYDRYKQHDDGMVIDLVKNFRSRKEVLADINTIFSHVMDSPLGGATYTDGHAMVFGNQVYENEAKVETPCKLEILSYDDQDKEYTTVEKEAFIIANDIKEKMNSNYFVFDKDENKLRKLEYSDIVILLDRSTDFVRYKQIFEYLGIPLIIWKDESSNGKMDLFLIKNIFIMAFKMRNNLIDSEFKTAYTSLARSFLYQKTDEEIYNELNGDIKKSNLYQDFESVIVDYDTMTPSQYFLTMITKLNYEQKLTLVGQIDNYSARLEYFYQLIHSLEKSNFTIEEIANYFKDLTASGLEIRLPIRYKEGSSVKIMTIHTSKGLEYPLCYFAGFTKKFNNDDTKKRVLFDADFGIVISDPDEESDIITRTLLVEKMTQEDISERIRLLYVALTRAREKMILVLPQFESYEEVGELVDNSIRYSYNSFYKIMKSVSILFQNNIKEINKIDHITKSYLEVKKDSEITSSNEQEEVLIPSQYSSEDLNSESFSKTSLKSKTQEELELLEYGTKVHEILERCDIKNKKMPIIHDEKLKNKISAFLHNDLFSNIKDYKVYQEYEFMTRDGSKIRHGIIDLLLVSNKDAIIIDYKLSNVKDSAYLDQLRGYKTIITAKLHLPVTCYLYSIMQETLTKIENI